ncbi:unnamed protein product [Mucor hiemalis]
MSAVGSRETTNHIINLLRGRNIYLLDETILYRDNATTPSSTIIQNQSAGSRTIISHANLQDITCDEFKQIFEKINDTNRWWVHFEGRNIENTLQQIDYLHHKATVENWRDKLTISVELEKPERENIHLLIERGDVVFFSRVFAESHGFSDSKSFLKNFRLLRELMKPSAVAYCTWGAGDASVLDRVTYYNDEEVLSFTPRRVDVVDSVGAGDTFIAGVIGSLWHSKYTSLKALELACDLASTKVSIQGLDGLMHNDYSFGSQ